MRPKSIYPVSNRPPYPTPAHDALQGPGPLVPHSPAPPVSDTSTPRVWSLYPVYDPLVCSPHGTIRCLKTEVATTPEAALTIALDIEYSDPDLSENACVKLILGDIDLSTNVQASEGGHGTISVRTTVPGAALKEDLLLTLRVLSDGLVRDQLDIGIVHLADAQGACKALSRAL